MKTYQIMAIDVWGNAKDGYEINDMVSTDDYFEVKDDASDTEILKALRKALGHRCDARGYHDPYQNESEVFFCRNSDGMPCYVAHLVESVPKKSETLTPFFLTK